MTWNVDFSGVSDGGSILPGKYIAKVKNITKQEGTSYPYLKWELVILTPPAKGLTINHITTLKPEGLFNLRNTLLACGFNVPKAAVKLDPKAIIGKKLGIEVDMREVEGKEYPRVKKTFKPEDDTADILSTPSSPVKPSIDDDVTVITDDDL